MGCILSVCLNAELQKNESSLQGRTGNYKIAPQIMHYQIKAAHQFAGAGCQSQKQSYWLIEKLSSILMKPFQKADQENFKKILILAQQWKLNDQNYSVFFKDGPYLFKQQDLYKCFLLTARVLQNLKSLFQILKREIPTSLKQVNNIYLIQKYIIENKLEMVNSRLLFTQKTRHSQLKKSLTEYIYEEQHPTPDKYKLQRFYNYCKENKSQYFHNLLINLAKVDIIQLEDIQPLFINEFMDKVEKISDNQKKQMLIENYSFHLFQNLNSLKNSNEIQKFEQILKFQQILPNYMFYCRKRIIRENMDIQKLHDKYKDYQFLEDTHDYIQWMFPNHYGSSFNSDSFPLNYLQSQLFLLDIQVAKKMYKSLVIFLDFMGVGINSQCKLVITEQQRLKNVILLYNHNHLRIMRILACLSVTGFRQIAENLVDFLDYLTKKDIFATQRRQFDRSWKLYGKSEIEKAKIMCFLQNNQFPSSFDFCKKSDYNVKIQRQSQNKNPERNNLKNKSQKKYVNQLYDRMF